MRQSPRSPCSLVVFNLAKHTPCMSPLPLFTPLNPNNLNRTTDTIVAMVAPKPPPQTLRDLLDGGIDEEDEALLHNLKLPSTAPRWQKRLAAFLQHRLHIPEFILALLFSVKLKSWVLLIGWIALSKAAAACNAGPPFLVLTVITLILLNLGTRTGGLSGYSVFNPNVQRLPGQLTAEDLDAAIRQGNM